MLIKVTVFSNVMVCCLLPIYEITQCKIPGEVILIFSVFENLMSQVCSCCYNRLYTRSLMTYKHYFECHDSQFSKHRFHALLNCLIGGRHMFFISENIWTDSK